MESTNTSSVTAQEKALCAECGKAFPKQDMLVYGTFHICASCKPAFQQKVAEGSFAPADRRYASVRRRFAAVFIDGLITYAVVLVGGILVGAATNVGMVTAIQSTTSSVLHNILSIAYSVFMIGKYGATLGKMAMGIKVIRSSGAPFGYMLALGRWFAQILNVLTFLVGYLMAIWDKEKRGLHDRVCGTRVVHV